MAEQVETEMNVRNGLIKTEMSIDEGLVDRLRSDRDIELGRDPDIQSVQSGNWDSAARQDMYMLFGITMAQTISHADVGAPGITYFHTRDVNVQEVHERLLRKYD